MGDIQIITSLGFSLPMFTSLVCLIMLLMYYRKSDAPVGRKLTRLMIFTYISAFFCWFGILLYALTYNGFVWFNTFFFLFLMIDQVLLYHVVFTITGTGTRRKFYAINYIIPVVLTLAMGVWSLLTPYEVQYYIVESRGENAEGYLWYSRFFSSTVPIFIIYNILYPLLGLYRIRNYRREVVNYSADEQRASARWLYQLIFLIWLTLPIAAGTLFIHKSEYLQSGLIVIGAFLPIFQYLMICYNLISDNYVIIQPPTKQEVESGKKKHTAVNRKQFERYISTKKPYLNPKLKITDVSEQLATNRSYLSAFINREYGVNFSRYINRLRLGELDRLRSSPAHTGNTNMDLVLMAGFSSYRSYLRVKEEEDRSRLLKVFE